MATVQAVERAFDVLEAVAGEETGVTTIARRVGLPKSTVARLLATLEAIGAVERVDGALWRLGARVGALAAGVPASRSLAALAQPLLAELAASVGEDAGLSLPDGYDMHYVGQAEADNPVQVRDWTDTRAPMHTVPSGLVLLAEWAPEALDAYVGHGLARLTPHTVTDRRTLARRLREARADGCAWGREEFAEGISSVAAPVRDAAGRTVAAIHVHGPSYRFPAAGRDEEIAARVVAAAVALSAAAFGP
jgi:IclR family pca regulon transcriptional regulator